MLIFGIGTVVDMAELEKEVRSIVKDGLLWGSCKHTAFAFSEEPAVVHLTCTASVDVACSVSCHAVLLGMCCCCVC